MMRPQVLLTASLLACAAPAALAQGSGLGIVGLGIPGRFVSARDAGTAGGVTLFDPEATLNPASIGRWRAAAGWATAAPSRLSLESADTSSELRSMRFPLFGFASRLRPRIAIAATVSDYLDRSYEITRRDTVDLRGTPVGYDDISRSHGGVSDLRLAAAYTFDRVWLALAVHAYAGSSRLVASRRFDGDAYEDFIEVSQTDFSGMGLSAGTIVSVLPGRLDAGASVRIGDQLTAKNTTGRSASVPLPTEIAFGVHATPAPSIGVAATVQRAGWSRARAALVAAGQGPPRDAWSVGIGIEIQNVDFGLFHSPLRLGWRTRQLPFPIGTAELDERAFSGGLSLLFAQNRTTVDLGFERGSRSGGAVTERFSTLFVGITVRP
ncbi:MAG TPA: hypothetical protein VNL98_09855 [Gemmatimonadales bacterium]|nr:hypothetical protein [Gemmatimonadales bacterium]